MIRDDHKIKECFYVQIIESLYEQMFPPLLW